MRFLFVVLGRLWTGRGIGGLFVDTDRISEVLWEPDKGWRRRLLVTRSSLSNFGIFRGLYGKTKQDRVRFYYTICSLATDNSSWAENPQGGALCPLLGNICTVLFSLRLPLRCDSTLVCSFLTVPPVRFSLE